MPSGGTREDAVQLEAVTDVRGTRHVLAALPAARGSTPESWLAATLDTSPAIVWLKDREGLYLRVNQCYSETFGVAEDDLKGRSDSQLDPRHAVDGPRLDGGGNAPDEPLQLEYTVDEFEGRPPLVALRFPIRDASGEPVAVCGVAAPVHEAHIARQESDRLLRIERWGRLSLQDIRDEMLQHWRLEAVTQVVLPEPQPEEQPRREHPDEALKQELAEERRRVVSLREANATVTRRAHELLTELTAAKAQVEELEHAREQSQARIAELENVGSPDAGMKEALQTAERAETAAAEQRKRAVELESALEEQRTRAIELEEALAVERTKTAELKSVVRTERERVAEAESGLAAGRDRAAEVEAALEAERARAVELEAQLGAERTQVAEYGAALANERERVEQFDAALSSEQTRAQRAEAIVAKQREQARQLELAAGQASDAAHGASRTLAKQREEIDSLSKALHRERETVSALRAALESVRTELEEARTAAPPPPGVQPVPVNGAASPQLEPIMCWHPTSQRALTETLAGASEWRTGLKDAVRILGAEGGWDAVAAWAPEERGRFVKCIAMWAKNDDLSSFETSSWQRSLPYFATRLGSLFTAPMSTWLTDLAESEDARLREAAAAGIRSALLVPIRDRATTIGVLELLSRDSTPPDSNLTASVEAVALQLGHFSHLLREVASPHWSFGRL